MARSQQDWIDRYTVFLEEYLHQGTFSSALEPWILAAIAARIPLSTVSHWHHHSLSLFLPYAGGDSIHTLLSQGSRFQSHTLSLWNQMLEGEAKTRWRVLGEQSADMIWILDHHWRILEINPAVERILGYSPDQLVGKIILDGVHPEDLPSVQAFFQQLTEESPSSSRIEYRFRHQAGSWPYLQSTGTNLLYDQAVRGVVIYSREVSSQKQLDSAVQESLEFERLIGSLSTQLMQLGGMELERGIEEGVRCVAQWYHCDRAMIFELTPAVALLRYQWYAGILSPLPSLWHQISVELIPWWMQKLQNHEVIAINSWEDFPSEARAEQAIVSAIQAQSLLILPLVESTSLKGYLGFSTSSQPKTWSIHQINQLQRVTELFAHALKRQQVELTWEHLNEEMEIRIDRRTQELQAVNRQLAAEILERQHIEQALRESETRFRRIFEDSPLGIAIFNEQKRLERVNTALCRMLGYFSVDLQSLSLLDLFPADDRDLIERLLGRLMRGEIPGFQLKQRFVHRTEEMLWVKLIASTIASTHPFGTSAELLPTYGIVMVEDITKGKQAEETLQLIQFTLNRVMDSVLLVDAEGHLIYVNDRACQTLEYSREQLLGMRIGHIDRSCGGEFWPRWWQQVKNSGFMRVDSTYCSQSGGEIPVEINLNFFQYKGLEYSCAIARDLRDRQQAEAALAKSQQLFAAAQKVAGLGSWELDLVTEILFWSDEVFRIFGQDPTWDKAPTYAAHIQQYHTEDQEQFQALVSEAIAHGKEYSVELRIVRPSGEIRTIWIQGQPIFNPQGKAIKIFGIIQDITQRKQVELALKENETRYRTLVSHIPGVIYRCLPNSDWSIEFVSNAIEILSGYSPPELVSNLVSGFAALIHPEDLPRIQDLVATALAHRNPFELEYRMVARDGTIRWVYEKGQGVWNDRGDLLYLDGAIFDVSDRKQAEEQLKSSLAEKEVLLREIHHRVKNNLNIIYSLLDMQSRQVSDPSLQSLLQDSQKRLKTMALIHEKLYFSQGLSKINFAEYIHSLVLSISASYRIPSDQVKLEIEADPVKLNIETAIPTGLIINELVTNALKHAFPQNRGGIVWIKFRETKDGQLDLRVIDNGVGLPADVSWQYSTSLGMRLIHILADQIDAHLEVKIDNGTGFYLRFNQCS